jgi:hypothetical protein
MYQKDIDKRPKRPGYHKIQPNLRPLDKTRLVGLIYTAGFKK